VDRRASAYSLAGSVMQGKRPDAHAPTARTHIWVICVSLPSSVGRVPVKWFRLIVLQTHMQRGPVNRECKIQKQTEAQQKRRPARK
jgi:hypothetical protein